MKRVLCLYKVSTIGQVDHDDIPVQAHCMQGIHCPASELGTGRTKFPKRAFRVTKRRLRIATRWFKSGKKRSQRSLMFCSCSCFDRIDRRDDETPFVVQWFVENGIEVWSVKEGEQRFDNHVDKLFNYIRFWQAFGESEKTSMRIRTKHLQMIQGGTISGRSHPFGLPVEIQGKNQQEKPAGPGPRNRPE